MPLNIFVLNYRPDQNESERCNVCDVLIDRWHSDLLFKIIVSIQLHACKQGTLELWTKVMKILIINGSLEFWRFLCFHPCCTFFRKFLMQKQLHIRHWTWNDRTDLHLEASLLTGILKDVLQWKFGFGSLPLCHCEFRKSLQGFCLHFYGNFGLAQRNMS